MKNEVESKDKAKAAVKTKTEIESKSMPKSKAKVEARAKSKSESNVAEVEVVRNTKPAKKIKKSSMRDTVNSLLTGVVFAIWTGVALTVSMLVVNGLMNSFLPREVLIKPVTELMYSAITYVFCVLLVVFIPWLVLKMKTTRDEMGLRGLPTWTDILLSPIGFIFSLFLAGVLTYVMQSILPGVDWSEAQDVGFNFITSSLDKFLAFLALAVIAPIAEEIIFRGWLYGKLRARMSALPAILIVSILFGIMHGQWNVGVTVFCMSIVMCVMREFTGTIYGGILLHMIKNGLAFYLLFGLGLR